MQNEITASIPLLDASGYITQEGWARHPYWIYAGYMIEARFMLPGGGSKSGITSLFFPKTNNMVLP